MAIFDQINLVDNITTKVVESQPRERRTVIDKMHRGVLIPAARGTAWVYVTMNPSLMFIKDTMASNKLDENSRATLTGIHHDIC